MQASFQGERLTTCIPAIMASERVRLVSSQSHSSGSSDSGVAPSRARTVLSSVARGVKGVLGLPDKMPQR